MSLESLEARHLLAGMHDIGVRIDSDTVQVIPGDQVSYTITVDNAGPDTAQGTTVTSSLGDVIQQATWRREVAWDVTANASSDRVTEIQGISSNDQLGRGVSGGGDVNGDGIDDVVVGAWFAASETGEAYVLFGSAGAPANDRSAAGLDGTDGFVIRGNSAYDNPHTAYRVDISGDINGDSIDDVVLAAVAAAPGGNAQAGEIYVVFGTDQGFPALIELSQLNGTNGFSVSGTNQTQRLGEQISSGGDLNSDGRDDLIVGDINGNAYVVYGADTFPANLSVASLDGSTGFTVPVVGGTNPWSSISHVSDLNDDGFDDMFISVNYASPGGRFRAGTGYVVFGSDVLMPASFDLTTINGTNGFALHGVASWDQVANSAASAGDFNNDGIDDLVIGSFHADPQGVSIAGQSYVLFGSASGFAADVELSALDGANGFVLDGGDFVDYSGYDVSAAGDVNQDGIDDLLVSAILGETDAPNSGETYLLFGATGAFPARVKLNSLDGSNGLILSGRAHSYFGIDVSAAGDFNADGSDDLIIGAPLTPFAQGSAYIVYGSPEIQLSGTTNGPGDVASTFDLPSGFTAVFQIDGISKNTLPLFPAYSASAYASSGTDYNPSNNVYSFGQGLIQREVDVMVEFDDGDRELAPGEPYQRSITITNPSLFSAKEADIDIQVDPSLTNVTWTKESETPGGFGSTFSLEELSGGDGFAIPGVDGSDLSGSSISDLGDFNGDGFDDVVIGAEGVETPGEDAGAAYVVFGSAAGFPAEVPLASLDGTNGFAIAALAGGDLLGVSVGGADINGDGLSDLLIGASGADAGGLADSGNAYVVYGTASPMPAVFNLATLDGANGFTIGGGGIGDGLGRHIAAVGDLNADGVDDIFVGSLSAAPQDVTQSLAGYVLYGKAGGFTANVDLGALNPEDGFLLSGDSSKTHIGWSGWAAGDVNGDGIDDLVVRSYQVHFSDYWFDTQQHVLFGSASGFGTSVDLSMLDGTDGFSISGTQPLYVLFEGTIGGLDGAGDINGDGIDDLLVSVPRMRGAHGHDSGKTYVIFGTPTFDSNVDLQDLGDTGGFAINGVVEWELSGKTVAGAGDINGDGIADLVIGTHTADHVNRHGDTLGSNKLGGRSYVVYGPVTGVTSIDLDSRRGDGGFWIEGVLTQHHAGHNVSAAGDVNGDGIKDLLVSAPRISAISNTFFGESYVIFGRRTVTSTSGSGAIDQTIDIPAGATITYTIDATIPPGVGSIATTASTVLNSWHRDLNTLNNYASVTDRVANDIDLTVQLSSPLQTVIPLDPVSYTLTVTNNGPDPALDATVETLLAGILDNPQWTRTGTSTSGSGDLGDTIDLAVGETATYEITGTIPAVATGTLTVDALASASPLQIDSFLPDNSVSLAQTVGTRDVDLQVTTDGNVQTLLPGDAFNRVVAFQNAGPYDEPQAQLVVDLAPQITGVSWIREISNSITTITTSGTIPINQTLPLPVGFTVTYTITGTVSQNYFGDLVTAATVTPSGIHNDTDLSNNTVSITDTVTPYSGLSVSLQGNPSEVVPLEPVTYLLDVTNIGQDTAVGASIDLPFADVAESVSWRRTISLDLANLNGTSGLTITGSEPYGKLGNSVSRAGDINDDGIGDVIVGASRADAGGQYNGASYVVFGTASGFPAELPVDTLDGTNGFAIHGDEQFSYSGFSVAGAGDVNGDGIDDLVVGAPESDLPLQEVGKAYVVFGSAQPFPATIDLGNLDGSNGFSLTGAQSLNNAGYDVAAAGDLNGDGIEDLAIGAIDADGPTETNIGQVHIVFGTTAGFAANVDLAALDGTNGFTIDGPSAYSRTGSSIGSAGDVNADGIDDLILGAPQASPNSTNTAGQAYVIFGSTSPFSATFDLSLLDGTGGLAINGTNPGDRAGSNVRGLGDVNGDGIDDIGISATGVDDEELRGVGAVYVVYGSSASWPGTLELSSLDGTNGFQVNGSGARRITVVAVGAAGDFNGDGLNDVALGAPNADPDWVWNAGETYLLFGSADTFDAQFSIDDKDQGQFLRIAGIDRFDGAGNKVDGAGDVNGDGVDDLIIAAPGGDQGANEGESYIIFGSPAYTSASSSGSGDINQTFDMPSGVTLSYVATGVTATGATGSVTATATSDSGSLVDNVPGDDVATVTQTVHPRNVDLVVDVQQIGPAAVQGESIQREVRITNKGQFTALGATIDAGINGDVSNISWTREIKLPVFGSPELYDDLLDQQAAMVLDGADTGDSLGYSVSNPGDVNGDGFDDLVIGAGYDEQPGGPSNAGAAHVLFGSASGFDFDVDVSQLDGTNGFTIAGIAEYDLAGFSVSGAGDVNNDGTSDLLVSTPYAGAEGEAYVVFGSTGGFAPVFSLSSLDGTNGFRVFSNDASSLGFSAAGLGDVNGDGIDDIAVGAPASASGDVPGKVFVIYGSSFPFAATIDTVTLDGTIGFTIDGEVSGQMFGFTVNAAGDINDDGIGDLVVGAPRGETAYVLFGSVTGFAANVQAASIGDSSPGLKINNDVASNSQFGYDVGTAGDFNGDGVNDVIVGDYGAYLEDPVLAAVGQAIVVFGSPTLPSTIRPSELTGTNGLVINGYRAGAWGAHRARSIGDINADGIDDVFMGQRRGQENFVVFGSDDGFPAVINTEQLSGADGSALYLEHTAYGVSNPVDTNGDGIDDLVVGISSADPVGASDAGKVYAFFGRQSTTTTSGGGPINETLDVPPGAVITYLIDADIAPTGSGTLTMTASATEAAGHTEIAPADNTDTHTETIITPGSIDLAVNLSATPEPVGVGELITYTLEITNQGIDPATQANVQLTPATLLKEVTFSGPTSGSGPIDAVIDLLPGATAVYTITGRIPGNAISSLMTTVASASAALPQIDTDITNNSASLTSSVLREIDLSVEVTSNREVPIPLQPITYEITVANHGPDAALGASLESLFGGLVDNPSWTRSVSFDLASLDGENGLTVSSLREEEELGTSVSSAGDFNGDGIEDFVVGVPGVSVGASGNDTYGAAFLIYGTDNGFPANIDFDIASLDNTYGFMITPGVDHDDSLGTSVSGAGDINGDGFDDLIIGAPYASAPSNSDYFHQAYIMYGSDQAHPAHVYTTFQDVIPFGRIGRGSDLGEWVSGAGDVNGDGYDDVLVGEYLNTDARTYVLFGSPSGLAETDIHAVNGVNGFSITKYGGWGFDFTFAGAGDINADGYDDIVVGSKDDATVNGGRTGAAYVVYGGTGFTADIDVAALNGSNGFTIPGLHTIDGLGSSVAAAGDVNGDDIDDLVIGAKVAESDFQYGAGNSYVIFGSFFGFGASLDLSTLNGTNGFVVEGILAADRSGDPVSSAGDVNADGFDDILIAAPYANSGGKNDSGETYLLFGSNSAYPPVIQLSDLDPDLGFTISGTDHYARAGFSVSAAGDVDGDLVDDVIIGAPGFADLGRPGSAGQAFVVFGSDTDSISGQDSGSGDLSSSFDLPPGFVTTFTVTGTVPADAQTNHTITASVTAADHTDVDPANNQASLVQSIQSREVDVQVVIDQNVQQLTHGGLFTRTFTVTNDSDYKAIDTEIQIDFGGAIDNLSWTRWHRTPEYSVVETDRSNIDINQGFTFSGLAPHDRVGFDVTDLGDINNDGIDDVAIASREPEVYVVFGSSSGIPSLDKTQLDGTNGFVITGTDPTSLNSSIDRAGDVNDDGINDLVIGDWNNQRAYVVFGSATSFAAAIDVSQLDGSNGFYVEANNVLGLTVAGAGDLNNDGIDDLAFGYSEADHDGKTGAGEVYVLYGSPSFPASVDLSSPDGTDGFLITGAESADGAGHYLDGLDDFNGDGISDLAIGLRRSHQPRFHILYGSASGFAASLDLSSIDGSSGLLIDGLDFGAPGSGNIASAGDINGDGLSDVVSGLYRAGNVAGRSYVVFGFNDPSVSELNVSELNGQTGFVVNGDNGFDQTGYSVSSAGDFNGDNIDDLLIGASSGPENSRNPSTTYVLFGSREGFDASIDLSLPNLVDGKGFLISGPDYGLRPVVSPAGDVNADGADDILVGNYTIKPGDVTYAGMAYVVFGGRDLTITGGTGPVDKTMSLPPGASVRYVFTGTVALGVDHVVSSASAIAAAGNLELDSGDNVVSHIDDVIPAPTVESIEVNEGDPNRSSVTSVSVTFDTEVEHGALQQAFVVTNETTGEEVETINVSAVDDNGKTTASLTFDGTSTVGAESSRSLADGNYRLLIYSGQVTHESIALDGDGDGISGGDHLFGEHEVDAFFRYFSDYDGDRDVDTGDLIGFARTFRRTSADPNFDPAFDSDLDGDVDSQDLIAFARNFRRTLTF